MNVAFAILGGLGGAYAYGSSMSDLQAPTGGGADSAYRENLRRNHALRNFDERNEAKKRREAGGFPANVEPLPQIALQARTDVWERINWNDQRAKDIYRKHHSMHQYNGWPDDARHGLIPLLSLQRAQLNGHKHI